MSDEINISKTKIPEYTTLNEGDSSYHFLFDENPSLSFIINYERLIQDVNKKTCEVLGYRKIDLIGKDPLDLIHPSGRMLVSNILDQLFNKEKVGDINSDVITSSGMIKNILFTHGRLVEYNKRYAVLLTGVDVTEINGHEFDSNKELITNIMNFLSAGIFIKDDQGRYVFRNKYLSENFDIESINSVFSKEAKTDKSLSRFVKLKDKNNREHFCETTTFKLNAKEFKKYTGGIIFDITDRIESEKQKIETLQVLDTLLNLSDSGIILADTEGRIIQSNPAFSRLTGYLPDELKKINTCDITYLEDLEEENKLIKNLIEGSGSNTARLQKRFITKKNETVWVNLSFAIINYDEGSRILEIAEDITEQKLIKDMFSVIAHDLRSHFHALLGLSELLADDKDNLTGEEFNKIGKELHAAFRNEYSLLENLLAWSKLQKDNIQLAPDVVNLSEAADDIIRFLSWLSEKKRITIKNQIDKKIKIVFDANLLQSVLQNILSNALKFSNEGSTVKISYISGDTPALEVTDEGTGLSEEEINKILKHNLHFTKPGTAREQGTGLGLIICREFIEKHGGKLYIKSTKGKGSTVGFTVKPG